MNKVTEGELEQEFLEIWRRLVVAGATPLAVAGGQGLLLKQNWLKRSGDQILVPLDRWIDVNPRATKDFDLVVDLGLIADEMAQGRVTELLTAMDYQSTIPRWQFTKDLGGARQVVVEFHAEVPDKGLPNVRTKGHHITHKPSLGESGIHGRANEEAAGCHLYSYIINLAELQIPLPNPVTWSVMKLTAMADMVAKAGKHQDDGRKRRFFDGQAKKHASDVCRIMAMTSRAESRTTARVIDFLKDNPAFSKAADIAREYFSRDEGWGTLNTKSAWAVDDHAEMRAVLLSWFSGR
ncbi:MAG: hypothetical protein JWO82_2187 [Akkermansiaceae bacterium]|nr:hypothetical protein [Akkermansiaceae bacterium]